MRRLMQSGHEHDFSGVRIFYLGTRGDSGSVQNFSIVRAFNPTVFTRNFGRVFRLVGLWGGGWIRG